MPDQKIGKVTIKSSPQPSLTNNVSSVTVRVNDQNTQRVGTIQYSGGGGTGSNLLANAAFNQANNAFEQANLAFDAANTASQSTGAFARANSAYAQANSAASFANGAFARANAAFLVANSDPSFANGAFSTANAAFDVANSAFDQANNSFNVANAAFTQANNSFSRANNSFNVANAAFTQANNSFNVANLAYSQANIATPAFAQANNAFNVANAAFGQANNSFNRANNSFNVANASFNQANNAFNSANNRVLRAGDTMTGLLKFNTSGNTIVGPVQFAPGIDLFADAPGGYAQLNYANTNFIWVDSDEIVGSTSNTYFELKESARHFKSGVTDGIIGKTFELSLQEGFVVNADASINGQANVTSKLAVGTGAYVLLPDLIAQFTGNSSTYSQVNQQNLDANGSADFVVTADIGTDSAYFTDLGKAGSNNYSGTLIQPLDSYLIAQGNDANRPGANLFIITQTSGFGDIVFAQGGIDAENETARFVYGDGFIIKRSLQANGIVDGTYNLKDYTSLVYNYANTISSNVTLAYARANAAFTQANIATPAFNQANNAFNVANAAFGRANNSFNVTNVAFGVANSAASFANGAFDRANSSFDQANTGASFANGAFVTANSAASFSNSAYAWANAAYDFANTVASQGAAGAFIQANNAYDQANSSYNQANSSYDHANTVFNFANSAYAFANTGYTQANNAASFANGAFNRANSSYAFANTGYTQANNAASFANGAFDRANSAYAYANTGYAQANSAASFANGAFSLANTKFSSSGGTISGDVSVTGNLSVAGTVTSVNTQILLVRDNIVTLDSTVPINVPAPSIDSGIEVNRGLYQNTQLVWSEVAGAWRMSDGNTFASIASANLVQAAFGQSNNAFNVANSAFNVANAAFLQANNAFNVTNVAFGVANSAASFANGAFTQANNAASFANSAFTKANNALANTTGTFAGDLTVTGNVSTVANVTANYFVTTGSAGVITGANLIYSNTFIASVAYQFPDGSIQTTAASANIASASFLQANNAFNVANAAFVQANNSFNVTNVAFGVANSAASFANGSFTAANNAGSFANSAYAFANTGYTQANNAASFANGAFTTANSAASFANGAFVTSNSAASFANGAFARANSAYDFANTGYTQANNAASFANGSFVTANSAASFANSSYTLANTNAAVNLTQNTNIASAQSYANSAFNIANASFLQANNSFNVANAAFGQANNSFNVANVAYTSANNAGSFANSAYASANVKARVWESDTPPTANNYDLWIDSSNGVSYVYTTSNGVSTWVEYGPIGTPLSNLGDFTFSSQTMTGSYANQDVIIYQMGTGNIVLHSANTVVANLIPNTVYSSIGTVANPWNKIVAANVTSTNVSVTGVVQVNNSTFLATSAAVSITGSNSAKIQTPSNDGYMLHVTGKDSIPTRIVVDSFGPANTYPLFAGRHARGTADNPSPVQANDILARFAGNGWGTTGFAPLGTARIDIIASETYTDTARGSLIQFWNNIPGSNTPINIATFNATSIEFTGHVNPQKGFIYTPRITSANVTSIVIDFATDSSIRATINADCTVSFINYTTGKVVDVWITNLDNNNTRTVTHGVQATNATNNSATKNIPSTSTMYMKYFCYDGDAANTFVAITQG